MIRVASFAVVLAACGGPTITGTTCDSDQDCNLFNAQGRCEPTGFCSFADETCTSGQRYSPGAAGELAGACVDGPATCGERDLACCGDGVCGANLVCTTEAGTCQCGAAGQPCCDGTTCADGLRCGDGATCGSTDVLQVAAGAGHACVLFADHTVSCWGHDFKPYAQNAGVGDAVIAFSAPTPIAGATDVVELRAGETFTCARKADATLWCWGHNENGQLGDASNVHSSVAVQVAGLTNVTFFDAGRMHACAVGTYSGTAGLWCWGRGGQGAHNTTGETGRLGNNSSADSNVPVAVDLSAAAAAGQTVRSLSAGGYHSCIVMSDDTVWCWGSNANGELGDGTTTPSKVPVEVDLSAITIPSGVTVDEVSCSDGRHKQESTCLRLSDGTAYCWGANDHGELGDGATTPRSAPSTPVDTSGLGGAKLVQLASAQFAKCGRTDTGDVWCWGEDRNGILGINNGNGATHPRPVQTTGLTGATHLDMSHKLACAVDGAQQPYCWGTNRRGQATGHAPTGTADAAVLQPTRLTL